MLIYLARGNLPWQNAKSDTEGAKVKKETPLETLTQPLEGKISFSCFLLTDSSLVVIINNHVIVASSVWISMLKKIRSCGFEEKPDYDFFSKSFEKMGAQVGDTSVYEWGVKGKSKAPTPKSKSKIKPTAKGSVVVADAEVSQEPQETSPSKSPAQKRIKSAHVKKAKASTSTKAATAVEDNQQEEIQEPVEYVMTVSGDPHRRRKAATKAVVAAAAATAAAKAASETGRYNLRSSRSSSRN